MTIHKIFGPPGTGKTTRLLKYLIQEIQDTPVQRIGYLAHTKASVHEAKNRLANLGCKKSDLKYVCTIHALAKRLAGIPSDAVWGLDSHYDEMESRGYELTRFFNPDDMFAQEHSDWNGAHMAWDVLRNQRLTVTKGSNQFNQHNLKFHLHRLQAFVDTYESVKRDLGARDFTDMLQDYVHGEWGAPPIDILFLDEAQDYSKLQWCLVQKLIDAGLKRVYIAGDDDQAVFTFTGSDEYGFLDFPCDVEEILEQSYRCPKVIGRQAEALLRKLRRRKEKQVQWSDRPGKYRPMGDTWHSFPYTDWVNDTVTTMIICRHRYNLSQVKRYLKEIGIPTTTDGKWDRDNLIPKMISYHDLRAGRSITKNEAANLARWIGDRKSAWKLAKKPDDYKASVADFTSIDLNADWIEYLSKEKKHKVTLSEARSTMVRQGMDILRKRPQIDLSTYHASKGREADRTVLIPDCSTVVYEEQEVKPDGELRLAYVGLTRARRECIVSLASSPRHMIGLSQ